MAKVSRFATAAFLVLLGCAATAPSPPATPAPPSPKAPPDSATEEVPPSRFPNPTGNCIFLRTIQDWKAVDPYRILVRTRVQGWQWEVLLDRRCSDILYANALKWDTPDTRVCDYRRDAITVPKSRCIITAIRPYAAGEEPAKAE
jgi:hypothetical protein